MIAQVILLATLATTSFAQGDIPLKVLYEIVPGFPHTDFCDRDGVTKYWIDSKGGNVRHISIRAKLKREESERKYNIFILKFEVHKLFVHSC